MTTTKKFVKVVALSLVMTGVAAVAGAQTATPAPKATAPAQSGQDRYVVGQAKPPEVGAPVLNMTLEDAIQRALDRNLDLKVQKLNPQIADYQLQQTRAFYRPTFTGTVGYNNASQQNTLNQTLEQTSTITTTRQTYNTTASMPFSQTGGTGTIQFNNSRQFTNSTQQGVNPNLTATMTANYSQPLLRNFRTDSNRTSLKTQQIARQISDVNLRASLMNTVAQVRNAYWDLRAAIENIEIQRRAVDLSRSFVEQNRTKVEVGTMAQIDVIQAESQQANAELSLVQAEATWRTAELAFKRLVAAGQDDDAYKATINPTDLPTVMPPTVDIQAAITSALAQRTDLDVQRKNLESSQLSVRLLENQALPDLTLSTQYAAQGVGGPSTNRSTGVVTPGGYSDALNKLFGLDTPTWNVQANFNYPLGMAAAKANLARTRLTLEQSQTQLKAQELTVATDVTNAGLQVQNTYKALLASQKARELAERQADAEQTKFEVGMSTNFTVVQQQQAMTSARTAELRALLTYIKALIEFERVQNVGR